MRHFIHFHKLLHTIHRIEVHQPPLPLTFADQHIQELLGEVDGVNDQSCCPLVSRVLKQDMEMPLQNLRNEQILSTRAYVKCLISIVVGQDYCQALSKILYLKTLSTCSLRRGWVLGMIYHPPQMDTLHHLMFLLFVAWLLSTVLKHY